MLNNSQIVRSDIVSTKFGFYTDSEIKEVLSVVEVKLPETVSSTGDQIQG